MPALRLPNRRPVVRPQRSLQTAGNNVRCSPTRLKLKNGTRPARTALTPRQFRSRPKATARAAFAHLIIAQGQPVEQAPAPDNGATCQGQIRTARRGKEISPHSLSRKLVTGSWQSPGVSSITNMPTCGARFSRIPRCHHPRPQASPARKTRIWRRTAEANMSRRHVICLESRGMKRMYWSETTWGGTQAPA